MMVYSSGSGVHGFTLDKTIGEFLLSHPDIHIPENPKYYSTNQGYEKYWSEGIKHFTDHLQGLEGGGKSLSMRYIGSLVGDLHRNLLAGRRLLLPGGYQGSFQAIRQAAPALRSRPAGFPGGTGGRVRVGWKTERPGYHADFPAPAHTVIHRQSLPGGDGRGIHAQV